MQPTVAPQFRPYRLETQILDNLPIPLSRSENVDITKLTHISALYLILKAASVRAFYSNPGQRLSNKTSSDIDVVSPGKLQLTEHVL